MANILPDGPGGGHRPESYDDSENIRGVQMWGEARLLTGAAKAGALALYVSRFPFVRDIIKRPSMAELMRGMGVYRVEPARVAFTDNLTGVFGREVWICVPAECRRSRRRWIVAKPLAVTTDRDGYFSPWGTSRHEVDPAGHSRSNRAGSSTPPSRAARRWRVDPRLMAATSFTEPKCESPWNERASSR